MHCVNPGFLPLADTVFSYYLLFSTYTVHMMVPHTKQGFCVSNCIPLKTQPSNHSHFVILKLRVTMEQ